VGDIIDRTPELATKKLREAISAAMKETPGLESVIAVLTWDSAHADNTAAMLIDSKATGLDRVLLVMRNMSSVITELSSFGLHLLRGAVLKEKQEPEHGKQTQSVVE